MDAPSAPRPSELTTAQFRARLAKCGVLNEVKRIYVAYRGETAPPLRSLARADVVRFTEVTVRTLGLELCAAIEDERAVLLQLLDSGEQVFRVKATNTAKKQAQRAARGAWGEKRSDTDRALLRVDTHLASLRTARAVLNTHPLRLELKAARSLLESIEGLWTAANDLLRQLPDTYVGTGLALPPRAAVFDKLVAALTVQRLVRQMLKQWGSQGTIDREPAVWATLQQLAAQPMLPRIGALTVTFLHNTGVAERDEFEGFLDLIVDLAWEMQQASPAADDKAWLEMLDACATPRDESWWRREPAATVPVDSVGAVVPACIAAEQFTAGGTGAVRLAALLPDAALLGRALSNGVLVRLGAIAIVAPRTGPEKLRQWLGSHSTGGELFRAWDGTYAPTAWNGLRLVKGVRGIAQQLVPALEQLRNGDTQRTRHLTEFFLASKSYGLAFRSRWRTDDDVRNEPKYTAREGWDGYLGAVLKRCDDMAKVFGDTPSWRLLWIDSAFTLYDIPKGPVFPARSPQPAYAPDRLGYAGGYSYRDVVLKATKDLSPEARSTVVPLLTVPLAQQWWGSGRWFTDLPNPSELKWSLRWLAVFDDNYRDTVFVRLCGVPGGANR